jgi:hypothetical protein
MDEIFGGADAANPGDLGVSAAQANNLDAEKGEVESITASKS